MASEPGTPGITGPGPWWHQGKVRRDLAVLALVLTILYALGGGHLALRSSIRYVESAREMVALGDWVVPQLNYVPYMEKPVLTYWLAAAARWAFGPSMHATHLPAFAAGLVSLFATYGLARSLRGGGFPFAATAFLLSSAMFLVMTTELTTDPILSGCLAVVWLAWWRHDRISRPGRPSGPTWWIWVFWVALGLGLLAKGPVAIVLAGMAIAGFAFLTDGVAGVFRTLWAMHPIRGVFLLAAVNAPWSLLVWQRDARFLDYFYVRFNFEAFFSDQVNHTGPWYLYLAVLPAAFFPWPLQTLAATGLQIRDHLWPALMKRGKDLLGRRAPLPVEGPDRLRLYLLSVLVFPFLFLSVSTSKLGTYLMPLFPAVALLVMDAIYVGRERIRPAAWLRWSPGITAGILVLAMAVAWPILKAVNAEEAARLNWSYWPVLVPAVLLLVLGNVWSALLMERRAILGSLLTAGAGTAFALVLILGIAHQAIRDLTSERVAQLVARHAGTTDPVVVDQELIHDYNFVYYLQRPVLTVGRARETGMGHFASVPDLKSLPFPRDTYDLKGENLPGAAGLWTMDKLVAALASPQRIWVLGEEDLVERLNQAGAKATVIDRAMNVVVFTNQPGPGGGWPSP